MPKIEAQKGNSNEVGPPEGLNHPKGDEDSVKIEVRIPLISLSVEIPVGTRQNLLITAILGALALAVVMGIAVQGIIWAF